MACHDVLSRTQRSSYLLLPPLPLPRPVPLPPPPQISRNPLANFSTAGLRIAPPYGEFSDCYYAPICVTITLEYGLAQRCTCCAVTGRDTVPCLLHPYVLTCLGRGCDSMELTCSTEPELMS